MNKFEIVNLQEAVNTTELRNSIVEYVKGFNIEDEDTYKEVKEALVTLKADKKNFIKPFEQEKKLAYEPYKLAQEKEKEIKDFFKEVENAFSSIITPFATELTKQKALEYASKVQEAKKEFEENGVKPPTIEKKADTAGLRQVTEYDVTVLNMDVIPREFLNITINKTAILNAHKLGIKVAGVIVNEEVKIK